MSLIQFKSRLSQSERVRVESRKKVLRLLRGSINSKTGWIILLFLISVLSIEIAYTGRNEFISNIFLGFGVEIIGAIVLYILFDISIARKEQKNRLAREMGSWINSVAFFAVEELRHEEWLFDGSLRGKIFVRADLDGVSLANADLQKACFNEAFLTNTNLRGTDLREAKFIDAKLQNADLVGADLRGAVLKGAVLSNAKLGPQNGNIEWATRFDRNTVLPDAEFNNETGDWSRKWKESVDMSKYTDVDHPYYWMKFRK